MDHLQAESIPIMVRSSISHLPLLPLEQGQQKEELIDQPLTP